MGSFLSSTRESVCFKLKALKRSRGRRSLIAGPRPLPSTFSLCSVLCNVQRTGPRYVVGGGGGGGGDNKNTGTGVLARKPFLIF